MKKLMIAALVGISLCACAAKDKASDGKSSVASQMKQYSNEYFSIKYPSGWVYEEEIDDKSDSVTELSKGIRTTFYNQNPGELWHTVAVQKSSLDGMVEYVTTPEEWRDFSVGLNYKIPEFGVI